MFSTRCLWIYISRSVSLVSMPCQPIEFAQLYRIHINAPHFTHKQLFSVAQPLLRLWRTLSQSACCPPYIFDIQFTFGMLRGALYITRAVLFYCARTGERSVLFSFGPIYVFMNAFSSLILLINHLDMCLVPFFLAHARALRMMLKVSFHGDCDKPNQLLALFFLALDSCDQQQKLWFLLIDIDRCTGLWNFD